MKRVLAVIALGVTLVGCSRATPAANQPSSSAASAQVAPTATLGARTPAPTASEPSAPTGLVAYSVGRGIRVINADGTADRPLLPGVSDPLQYPVAWSADGSRLLYRTGHGVGLTDAAGLEPLEVKLSCPGGGASNAGLASCQADEGGVALSPDGGRLAYTVWEGSFDHAARDATAVVVVLDIATGHVTRLGSTETTTVDGVPCRGDHSPAWSPDGKRLVFAREAPLTSGSNDCKEAILTVDVDGGDVRQLVDTGEAHGQREPSWSPDGSRILFIGSLNVSGERKGFSTGLYTVRRDGTDFHAVTGDGLSSRASWTRDGRIAFIHWQSTDSSSRGDQWVMDANGGNAMQLEATVPALTAAGCLICNYPLYSGPGSERIDPVGAPGVQLERFGGWVTLLWQPQQVD